MKHDILDLLNLVAAHTELTDISKLLKVADLILIKSASRVDESSFGTYKNLLEQIGKVLGPVLREEEKDFKPNLFGSDLSGLKLEVLEAFINKRLSVYEEELVEIAEEMLKGVDQ